MIVHQWSSYFLSMYSIVQKNKIKTVFSILY